MHWQVIRVETGGGTQRSGSSILPTLCLPADHPVGFWNGATGPTGQRLAARESWVSGRRGEATAGDPWPSDPPTLRAAPPVWRRWCVGAGVHALSQVKEERGRAPSSTPKTDTAAGPCPR